MADIFGTPNSGKSTPVAVASPCGRRLSIGTPSSLSRKNDAQEIRERRKSKILELQNKHISSPQTPNKNSPRNTSNNPLKGLSTNQLSDHYANCVKLNAENKINTKNAFGLHLIDYMTDLLRGKKLGDFQVAGTTLDASAKIYASRVDAIHTETYKVLSTLSRGNKKKNQENNEGEEGDEVSGAEDDDMPNDKVKKPVKKKTQRNKFIDNSKAINLDTFELEYEMDPLFKSLTTAFAEGLSSGLLLSALSCYTDSSELVLDSTTIIDDIESKPVSKTNKDPVGTSEVTDFLEKGNFYKSEICPSFSNFKFNNWNEADETMQTKDKTNSAYEFDPDAEAEDIPDDDEDDRDYVCDDVIFDEGGVEEDESVGLVGNNLTNPEKANVVSITDHDQLLKTTLSSISNAQSVVDFLSNAPSEYSFFNKKLLQTWRGPSHWKIHPMARSAIIAKKPSQSKPAVKKPKFLLDYEQERDFQAEFKKARSCVLTKKRLEVLEMTSFLLPKMLNYQPQALFGCFWKNSLMVRRHTPIATTDDDLVVGYDYDNENDKQNFCPDYNADYDDDNSEDLFGFSCATSNASQQSDIISMSADPDDPTKVSMLTGDDLVAQPHKVAKINISYAKTAKKVDVRRLKQSMWKLMTHTIPEENKENQEQNVEPSKEESSEDTIMKSAVLFSDLMKQIPDRVPSFMAKNISVPIAFVCMLHLANEKALKLNILGLNDIEISQQILS